MYCTIEYGSSIAPQVVTEGLRYVASQRTLSFSLKFCRLLSGYFRDRNLNQRISKALSRYSLELRQNAGHCTENVRENLNAHISEEGALTH